MAQIFLPRLSSERKLNIRTLHIFGLILIVVLMLLLSSSAGILARSVGETVILRYGGDEIYNLFFENADEFQEIVNGGNFAAAMTFELEPTPFYRFWKAWKVISYFVFVILLAATIVLLVVMRKFCRRVVEDTEPFDEPIRVKKAKYIWLGLLLGAFGAHLFAIHKKKKAWIYFGLGLGGAILPILILYTTGISFADAYLACFLPKDAEGMITIEDYPWWL